MSTLVHRQLGYEEECAEGGGNLQGGGRAQERERMSEGLGRRRRCKAQLGTAQGGVLTMSAVLADTLRLLLNPGDTRTAPRITAEESARLYAAALKPSKVACLTQFSWTSTAEWGDERNTIKHTGTS